MHILAAAAQFERELIRERVSAGMKAAETHGTKTGNAIGRPRRIFNRDEVVRLGQASRSRKLPIRCESVLERWFGSFESWLYVTPLTGGAPDGSETSRLLDRSAPTDENCLSTNKRPLCA